MIKNFLIAAALVIASPALVFSQDFFWSLDQNSLVTTDTVAPGTSGTAYLFSDGAFAVDALDINFTSSDSAVLLLTGGTTFNDDFLVLGTPAFNSSEVTINSGSDGRLFSASISGTQGIDPNLTEMFNPHFETGVGPNGGVLLASVDFDLLSAGAVTLDLSLGTQGALELPDIVLNPTFGSASLNVQPVPEPSTASLLVLGAVGLIARRKRS